MDTLVYYRNMLCETVILRSLRLCILFVLFYYNMLTKLFKKSGLFSMLLIPRLSMLKMVFEIVLDVNLYKIGFFFCII